MLVFFSSIGERQLCQAARGRLSPFIFLGVIAAFIMVQNTVGVGLATILGLDP